MTCDLRDFFQRAWGKESPWRVITVSLCGRYGIAPRIRPTCIVDNDIYSAEDGDSLLCAIFKIIQRRCDVHLERGSVIEPFEFGV